ncbi:nuclear transport factor 2 family protein [Streptomyces sp. NPDC060322]|uniref:nuclear transport factor 2 family protein n=1 Tax=unclassified Streptomyces TaxID=2593676 RepID=UPI0036595381
MTHNQHDPTGREIAALLDRYLINLDDDTLDEKWAAGLFTEDAVVAFPMSRHEGLDGLAEYHSSSLAAFERTQHINSPAVVVRDGDRATLRANLVSTHVHLARHTAPEGDLPPVFANGSLVYGEARRTARGWLLNRLSFRMIWMTGSPPPRGE